MKICSSLGVIRLEHFTHIRAKDLVDPSIPSAVRPVLITDVNDYRSKIKITSDVDTSPTVGKDEKTVTTVHLHLLQMRVMVETLWDPLYKNIDRHCVGKRKCGGQSNL